MKYLLAALLFVFSSAGYCQSGELLF